MAKDDNRASNIRPGEDIIDYSFEDLMGDRFGRYAKYIIQERALPDVRDGLKPVQRRILYGMKQLKLTSDKPYMKSARVVGDVMGKYHPHGDSSIYEALVRMSQTWKMGLPLIDMQGNNGSMDGDPAAAYRYTESRLQTVADFLLSDLDKDTVEFAPNYDDKDVEPTVLPAFFPNILINGSTGIAAGYATNMPPHNLGEVINATVAMIENPDIKLEQLMKHIKAPDFPTGGILQQLDGVKEAFATGKGKIIINSKWHQEGNNLIIDEIPYEVIKQDLVKKIGEVADANAGLGIKDIIDETDKGGLRISISLNPKASFETVRKFLFKATPLSVAYNYNNVVIINKQPKQVGLIEILKAYLEHYTSVYRRRTTYDLDKAKSRLEIVDGLIKAMSILDKIIAMIRKSNNRKDAIDKLKSKFDFSTVQSEAIVDMRLYRLSSTDVALLRKEKEELETKIDHFKDLLKKPAALNKEIIANLQQIKATFPTKRRSQLSQEDESFDIDVKDTVMERTYNLYVSQDGYLKAIDPMIASKNDFETFGRKPGDLFFTNFEVSNMDHLILVSSKGVYYSIPLFKVTTSRWRDFGMHVNEFAAMSGDQENIVAAIVVKDFTNLQQQLLVASKRGQIKRVLISDLETKTYNKSFRLMRLEDPEDSIVSANLVTSRTRSVVVVNETGYGVRYDLRDIPIQSTNSKGVKASSIKENIMGATPLTSSEGLLILTSKDNYKRIEQDQIPMFVRPKRGARLYPEKSRGIKELVRYSFSVNSHSKLWMINEQNKLTDLFLLKVKPTGLSDKVKPLEFHNIENVNLVHNFITDNTDELKSTKDYLAKTAAAAALMAQSAAQNQEKVLEEATVDLTDEQAKAAIDQRYENNLYDLFDQTQGPDKDAKTEEKDETISLELDDLVDDD